MEQDWNCPHCGKKIGTLHLTPTNAANPLPLIRMQDPTTGAQPAHWPTVIINTAGGW